MQASCRTDGLTSICCARPTRGAHAIHKDPVVARLKLLWLFFALWFFTIKILKDFNKFCGEMFRIKILIFIIMIGSQFLLSINFSSDETGKGKNCKTLIMEVTGKAMRSI